MSIFRRHSITSKMKEFRMRMSKLFTAIFMSMLTVSAMAEDANSIANDYAAQWNTAFNQSDSQAIAALYVMDAALSAGDGKVLSGREAIAGLFQGFIDAGVFDHSISLIKASQHGDTVIVLAEWSAKMKNEQGELITIGGVLSNYLVRSESEQWQSSVHVWNAGG